MLKELQTAMVNYFIHGRWHPILDNIHIEKHQDCKRLLNIYRDSILMNHLEGFKAVFPVCERLVGERFFKFLFQHYLKQFKHTSYDNQDYGKQFAQFLTSFEPVQTLPYLPDVASLEWACHLAEKGPKYARKDLTELSRLPENKLDQVSFCLPPSSSLLQSCYPILKIWHVNQPDFVGDQSVNLKEASGSRLLIWRQGLDLRIDSLNEMDWFCLEKVHRQTPLSIWLYELAQHYQLNDERCQAQLLHMFQKGWLVDFYEI